MTRKVRHGDNSLHADNLNLQSDAASVLQRRIAGGASHGDLHQQFSNGYQPADPDIVLVRNDTGCDLNKFDTVGLDYLVTEDDTPTYGCSRPNGCRHTGRFAVLTKSLANGQVGEAAVSGVSQMYTPQMGVVGPRNTNRSLSTTTYAPMTVDAGFFGTESRMQRAIGLHKVQHEGAAAVMYYDDIGSEYRDLANVKLRNPGPELVEANRSRCQCADGSCTYQCQESGGNYSWSLFRQDCDRADIRFSESGWFSYPTDDDQYKHTACSCDDVPLTARACNSGSLGEYLTQPCIAPSSTIATVHFADTDQFCGQYCIWHGETLIRGCDESCDSDCACLSPLELGNLTGTIHVGDKIPQLYRTPCLHIDEGGVCVHSSGDNGWTEVYNNCSAACPCEEPEVDASEYPAGYRFIQDCNRARCIPCSPAGACSWRYNEITVETGFWRQTYPQWTLVKSNCGPNCECAPEPPNYPTNALGFPINRFNENEVITQGCCKSPFGSPCDPTTTTTVPPTTSTTSTTPEPCTGTCTYTCPTFGGRWQFDNSDCSGGVYEWTCTCGLLTNPPPYACTVATGGSTYTGPCGNLYGWTNSTAIGAIYPLAADRDAYASGADGYRRSTTSTTTTTTTTTSTTTGHPTIDPSTTEEITASYVMSGEGTTAQPTCRTICVKTFDTINADGDVHQSGYTAMEMGNELGLCSRFGTDHACILFDPCNESTAGQVLEGICRRVDRNV